MKHETHLNWIVGIIVIVIILCGTLIWINAHSWTIRFEMDDNTRIALESIDFENLYDNSKQEKLYSEDCWISTNASMKKIDCDDPSYFAKEKKQ